MVKKLFLFIILVVTSIGVSADFNSELSLAKKGDKIAQHNVGVAYYEGKGVQKDISLAKKWISAAADQGYEKAEDALDCIAAEEAMALVGKLNSAIAQKTSTDTSKDYIDLGLPSGTLWKNKNENGFCKYNDAISKFGKALPTQKQFQELIDVCKWTWSDSKKGYTITGPNGNSIFLPALGWSDSYSSTIVNANLHGRYWSSTQGSNCNVAYGLCFTMSNRGMYSHSSMSRLTIRTVRVR